MIKTPKDQHVAMTITLTYGEVQRLHEEIGDIPKAHVGPKLFALYRSLDAMVWLNQAPRSVGRPKKL